MKLNPKIKNLFFQISAIIVLLSAIIHNFNPDIAKYTMMLGVAGFAASVITSRYQGKSMRGRRLYNMQVFAAIFMLISACLMYLDMQAWVIMLLISALLILYSTLMMASTYRKEIEEENETKE